MINEEWFVSSVIVFKNPIPVNYTVAVVDGEIQTLEGTMKHVAGAYITTGPKGEQYPISREKFHTLYDIISDTSAAPKKIFKLAKLADHDGELVTPWGTMAYTTGNDMIVRHGPNDYGVVKLHIFEQTYAKQN